MGFSSPPNPLVFMQNVWLIVSQIPAGRVSTYGQIASMIPVPVTMNLREYEAFSPRWVGGAMAKCPEGLAWQRVINSQGKISLRPGADEQKKLLEEEGVHFNENGRVDFCLFGWSGPDPEWCKANGFIPPKSLESGQPSLF